MAWYAPDSFRAQVLIIGAASLSMAVLAAILVYDAWQSTRRTLSQEAQQQLTTAVRELREQFADRATFLETSPDAPPLAFEAQDLSLRGLTAAVIRSYEGVEGGFLLGSERRLAGQAGPIRRADVKDFNETEARLLWDVAERSLSMDGPVVAETIVEADVLVAAAVTLPSENAIAWTLKRLSQANDPDAQGRRWWLAALVVSAVLGLGAIVSISIRLRQGVETLNRGLARLAGDFSYRLPPVGGDFGRVADAINRMAERRAALEATLRQQDRLAALGRVVAGVAHEIRNPLNSLVLSLELLDRHIRRGVATGEEVRQAIEEVNRLEQILARFLAFGGPKPESRLRQDLHPLLERALRVVQDQAQQKNVHVALAQQANGRLEAEVDALAIEQVLINLLLNAIDASPLGGTVTLSAAAEPTGVRVSIHDHGRGIPADLRDHVFDPYFTTKENGTGLGLAVSREIICHHGGSLDFESGDAGTTFVLSLPSTRESS